IRSGWRTASRPSKNARAFSSVTSTCSTSSLAFMRFRNFARFDLFSSFHIRVNCWSLSSAIGATASTLDENAGPGHGGRLGSSWELEDVRREEPRTHKAFLRNSRAPASICERHDQVVGHGFNSVGRERELRRELLRLARLQIPGSVGVLACDQELLPIDEAVRQHRPLVRAGGVDAEEAVSRRTTRMSYPIISKCFFPPSGTSSTLHRLTSVSIGRGEPPLGLKSLGT